MLIKLLHTIAPLLLPAVFLFLVIKYSDFFYSLLFGISLLFTFLFLKPSLFARKVQLPQVKKIFNRKFLNFSNFSTRKIIKKTKKVKDRKSVDNTSTFYSNFITNFIFWSALIFFTFVSIFKLQPYPKETNLFFSYYLSHFEYLRSLWVFVLGIFAILVLWATFKLKKSSNKKGSIFGLVFSISLTIFISFNFTFLTTYVLGIAHVNFEAFRINANPKLAGIAWGKDAILSRLEETNQLPKIKGVDQGIKKTIISLRIGGDDNRFYTRNLISSIPDSLFFLLNTKNETLVLVSNTLIVTRIEKDEIEAVSPRIGKLFIEKHFEPRYIKDEPNIEVLGKQEYLRYRDEQIDKKLVEVDKIIAWAQSSINILYGNIRTDKQQIEDNKAALGNAIAKRESEDKYCRTACYYYYYLNQCYRYFTDAQCDNYMRQWDEIVAQYQKNVSDWEAALGQDQRQLSEFSEYKKYFEDIRVLVETQKDIVPYELGVFEPESSIKVALESTSTKSLIDYFSTLVHEYLHYTSYVSEERILPTFFEEGLTEYFNRKVIGKEFNTTTNSGYSHMVKVIQEMAKKIPEEEFKRVYFTKDERALIALLNKEYGSKFYQDTKNYFWAMTLVSSEEALKFANNIMFRIGGKELKREDLFDAISESK